MKLRPLLDRVVVKRKEGADKSKGGIIIPDNARKPTYEGTVLAVGPGRIHDNGVLHKPDVKVGDHVIFGQYNGAECTVDDEKITVLIGDDILGVVLDHHAHGDG